MSESGAIGQTAEERFWERFIDRARKNGVDETAVRWHVRHAEAYLKAFPGKRLGGHTHEDVAGYLKHAGELDRMADCQFVQIVDAIRNLLVTARAPDGGISEVIKQGFRGSDYFSTPE